MDADYDDFEIARVIQGFRLIDSESYERQYRLPHLKVLSPGYYVVNWPENIKVRRFDQSAVFHGPFERRQEAERTAEWLRAEALAAVMEKALVSQAAFAARLADSSMEARSRTTSLPAPKVGALLALKADAKRKHLGVRLPYRSPEGADGKASVLR